MSAGLRSPKLTKGHPARHTLGAAGRQVASALNAVLANEQVYVREADRIAPCLDHHHDTTSDHPTTNRARTP
jgi:hypothetical protein